MDYSAFAKHARSLKNDTVARRRDLHRHPELGFEEKRTAKIVAAVMNELDLQVRTEVAQTGVIALLEGSRSGPVVLMRFDMDALPIQEANDVPYASTVPGVMHACGHDGHTAVGITVARMLAERRDQLAGKVKFVFQPAEEGLGGAEGMVREGALADPEPDYALAFHLWNERPVGWIGLTPGPVMAGAELFEISITGKGGHGAIPHEAVDPVLAAAQVVTALQSVVSRNVDPLESAVVSVTQVQAGETFNVIPEQVQLRGTIRTFVPEVRKMVLRRVEEIVIGVSASMGCTANVDMQQLTPPVVNDAELTDKVATLAASMFPKATLCETEVSMTSEDMAFMMQTIPGCYMLMGSNNRKKGLCESHHNPRFDFDEAVLPRAAALLAAAAWSLLNENE
ncbi:MAG: amidohydrolase [Anaerolineales bacterium]